MANPLTIGLAVASTAFDLIGGMQQASMIEAQVKAQQQAYNMQAQQTRMVAERNALMIRDQAAYNAAILERDAGQKQAESQRDFLEQQRIKRITQSRATAVAGASGGGVGDPTVLNIMGDIEDEGTFNALTALFAGDSAASLLNTQAALQLYEGSQRAAMEEYTGSSQASLMEWQGATARSVGDAQASATRMAAVGKAISSGSSLWGKYAPEDMGVAGGSSGIFGGSYKPSANVPIPQSKPTYYKGSYF